jgi:hypothetical protein
MRILHAATKWVFVCVLLIGCGQVAAEGVNGQDDLDLIDWNLAKERMKLLSQMGYHPFLMPLIMENRDMLALTKEQIKTFKDWRTKYRVPLIHSMNQIIIARVAFQRISLNPDTTEEVLLAKQAEIFKLHKKVLKYQLSCRRNILDTFTEEQWDNFRFLLIENGYVLD